MTRICDHPCSSRATVDTKLHVIVVENMVSWVAVCLISVVVFEVELKASLIHLIFIAHFLTSKDYGSEEVYLTLILKRAWIIKFSFHIYLFSRLLKNLEVFPVIFKSSSYIRIHHKNFIPFLISCLATYLIV